LTDLTDKKILVVDDEIDICELLAENLSDEGYNVSMANTGKEAVEFISNNEVDLVITDVRMPNGDGIYLLDEVRKKHKTKPTVVFITGYSDLSDEEAYEKGVDGIFHKPLDFSLFLKDVKKYLLPKEERNARQFDRIDTEDITLTFSQGSVSVKTNSLNISEGGLFVKLDNIFTRVGDVFDLTLEKEGVNYQNIKAVVRWIRRETISKSQPSGIGIEFLDAEPEKIKTILSKVQS
jgi:DNA-binding response OmpR family regulator